MNERKLLPYETITIQKHKSLCTESRRKKEKLDIGLFKGEWLKFMFKVGLSLLSPSLLDKEWKYYVPLLLGDKLFKQTGMDFPHAAAAAAARLFVVS